MTMPPWGPPDERSGVPAPPRRNAVRQLVSLALAGVVLVAATGAAAIALHGRDRDGSHATKIAHPDHWDGRVARFVSFVERTRGLDFDHPVTVKFYSEKAFAKRVTKSPDALTKDDKAEIRDSEAQLRALGLIDGSVDLFKAINQTSSEGILAFYDPTDETINVRGTEMDLATQVTVVHELTHALQDQHFDLDKLRKRDHDDDSGAITALIEGDASVVENAYVDSLSKHDRAQYEEESKAQSDAADFKGVPPVVRIMFGAPYSFGPALVDVLRDAGGQARLDEAFRDPPTAEEHVFDPTTYIAHDEPEPVAKPAIPSGAKAFDDGEFEPLAWFVMLSERIDAHEALRATDGWGGDRYVSYRTHGRACMRIAYRGERTSDTDEMRTALHDWINATDGIDASVHDTGSTILFESCDPGATAHVATGKSLQAIALPIGRVSILQAMLKNGLSVATSACIARDIVDGATAAELNDPTGAAFTSAAGQRRILDIAQRCRNAT
jgi:hypothetical protein